jgi:hypothetical protein
LYDFLHPCVLSFRLCPNFVSVSSSHNLRLRVTRSITVNNARNLVWSVTNTALICVQLRIHLSRSLRSDYTQYAPVGEVAYHHGDASPHYYNALIILSLLLQTAHDGWPSDPHKYILTTGSRVILRPSPIILRIDSSSSSYFSCLSRFISFIAPYLTEKVGSRSNASVYSAAAQLESQLQHRYSGKIFPQFSSTPPNKYEATFASCDLLPN